MGLTHYIAVLLGILFIFTGFLKLVPVEFGQGHGHSEMKSMFKQYLRILPVKEVFGITITTTLYMSAVGLAEAIFGSMLAFGRTFWRIFGAFYLIIIMIGAAVTHYKIGDPIASASVPGVLGVVLGIILLNRKGLSTHYTQQKTKTN